MESMQLTKLKWTNTEVSDPKNEKAFQKLVSLLEEISNRELTETTVEKLNILLEALNSLNQNNFNKSIKKTYDKVVQTLVKEEKMVPAGYYKMLWMSLGMAAFGIPMGVAFSASLDNYAFIGIGLPIGMVIGMAVGAKKDEDAKKKGLQLNVNM